MTDITDNIHESGSSIEADDADFFETLNHDQLLSAEEESRLLSRLSKARQDTLLSVRAYPSVSSLLNESLDNQTGDLPSDVIESLERKVKRHKANYEVVQRGIELITQIAESENVNADAVVSAFVSSEPQSRIDSILDLAPELEKHGEHLEMISDVFVHLEERTGLMVGEIVSVENNLRKSEQVAKVCKDHLIEKNMGLVKQMANRYVKYAPGDPRVNFEDFTSAGFNGLVEAIDRFKGEGRLTTYAYHRIRHNVQVALTDSIRHHSDSLDSMQEEGVTSIDSLATHDTPLSALEDVENRVEALDDKIIATSVLRRGIESLDEAKQQVICSYYGLDSKFLANRKDSLSAARAVNAGQEGPVVRPDELLTEAKLELGEYLEKNGVTFSNHGLKVTPPSPSVNHDHGSPSVH